MCNWSCARPLELLKTSNFCRIQRPTYRSLLLLGAFRTQNMHLECCHWGRSMTNPFGFSIHRMNNSISSRSSKANGSLLARSEAVHGTWLSKFSAKRRRKFSKCHVLAVRGLDRRRGDDEWPGRCRVDHRGARVDCCPVVPAKSKRAANEFPDVRGFYAHFP